MRSRSRFAVGTVSPAHRGPGECHRRSSRAPIDHAYSRSGSAGNPSTAMFGVPF